jgi:hypothetical protein
MRLVSLFLLAAAITAATFAQPAVVTVSTQNAVVDALTYADIDFYHSTSPQWLFTIDLRCIPPATSARVTMTVHLDLALSNGDSYTDAVLMITEPFDVAPSRTFTNLDFANAPLVQEFTIKQEVKDRYEGDIRSSQSLPAGTYTIRVDVVPTSQGRPETGSFAFVLTNPSAIELLSPMDADPFVNRFPLFQWRFDGQQSRIRIFERLPGQSSLEEATAGVAHATAEVSTNSYQYPSAGVRALEPGKTYVWFVEGLARTAGNLSSSMRSPLRSFTVATEGQASLQSYLDELERALGPKYTALFDRIRAERLALTGTMRVDGSAVFPPDLLRLITQFRNDPDAVLKATIE